MEHWHKFFETKPLAIRHWLPVLSHELAIVQEFLIDIYLSFFWYTNKQGSSCFCWNAIMVLAFEFNVILLIKRSPLPHTLFTNLWGHRSLDNHDKSMKCLNNCYSTNCGRWFIYIYMRVSIWNTKIYSIKWGRWVTQLLIL